MVGKTPKMRHRFQIIIVNMVFTGLVQRLFFLINVSCSRQTLCVSLRRLAFDGDFDFCPVQSASYIKVPHARALLPCRWHKIPQPPETSRFSGLDILCHSRMICFFQRNLRSRIPDHLPSIEIVASHLECGNDLCYRFYPAAIHAAPKRFETACLPKSSLLSCSPS